MKLARWYAAGAVLALAGLVAPGATWANFFATTANSGSSFSAASSFCVSPGTQAVTADSDAWVNQSSTGQNNGTTSPLNVRSTTTGAARRSLVHFALPALPHNCAVTSATLNLRTASLGAGRTIAVYQSAASWVETTVTWTNQPATTGSAATAASAAGTLSWSVTAQVQAMYSGTNTGFIVKDASESSGSVTNTYNSREAASSKPSLSVTFG